MNWMRPTLLFAFLAFTGCSTSADYARLRSTLAEGAGPHHVYAFYDEHNRLLNDPLRTLQGLVNTAEEPFTDVYVLSHGWNYTLAEAIDQYEDYLREFEDVAEELARSSAPPSFDDAASNGLAQSNPREETPRPRFRPLVLAVGWISVTRPLTETCASILPFGIDEGVRPFTEFVDSVAFHLPSTWRQSSNAAINALGRNFPDEYFGVRGCPRPALDEGPPQDRSLEGLDLPLSAVLYDIMRRNAEGLLHPEGEQLGIHCVGHSFGAKLIGLAAIEALRRFEYSFDGGRSCEARSEPPAERAESDGDLEATAPMGRPARRLPRHGVESLVWFNAALHPTELRYRRTAHDTELFAPPTHEILQEIPRKVCVYSNADFATGITYELSQIPLSNYHAHITQQSTVSLLDEVPALPAGFVMKPVITLGGGAVQLVFSSLMGTTMWAARRVWNLPQDFCYHLRSYEGTRDWHWSARYPANVLHFFVPVGEIYGGDADQRGLWRHSTPALGRTGLHRHSVGRSSQLPGVSEGFPSYSNSEPLRHFEGRGEIDSRAYVEMARTLSPNLTGLHARESAERWGEAPFDDPDTFYSLSGSEVLDQQLSDRLPLVGSHGSLRSQDVVELEGRGCGRTKLRRIRSTIQFIYNFTKMQ